MSRRSAIGEALASGPTEAPSPLETEVVGQRPTFTTKRLEAFTEAARIVKRPTIRLKPSECTIWPGNARDYGLLTEGRLKTLIDSILAEQGNRIPVVVRRTPNGEQQYELVIGTRRHWAISWLNANHYPNIDLVAIIEDLDDEAAFRLADIENREREDISDLERGANYKAAVERYYEGVQLRMAERLKMSKTTLARYVALTELPKAIVSAFNSPMDIHVKYGDRLLPLIRTPGSRGKMEAEAKAIAAEQSFRQSGDEEPISGLDVVNRLVGACTPKARTVQKTAIEIEGSAIGRIDRDQQRGLTITITSSGLPIDAVLDALRPAIENARIMKKAKA